MGFHFTPAVSVNFFVCVPAPWHINEFAVSCSNMAQTECITLGATHPYFSVWTSDPDAPAINLTAQLL
jgi:hypothetical protein